MTGVSVAGAHSGSAELHRATRRALRRRRSRAGALHWGALLTLLLRKLVLAVDPQPRRSLSGREAEREWWRVEVDSRVVP